MSLFHMNFDISKVIFIFPKFKPYHENIMVECWFSVNNCFNWICRLLFVFTINQISVVYLMIKAWFEYHQRLDYA